MSNIFLHVNGTILHNKSGLATCTGEADSKTPIFALPLDNLRTFQSLFFDLILKAF